MEEMTNRGSTRPDMSADSPKRHEMLESHHQKTLWIYWSLIILGFWLILTPLTFSYDVGVVSPSGGRSVWPSLSDRILAMKISDIVSGLLLMILGFRSLKPNRPVSLWAACFVGVWLSFAPILFWAPTAVAYYNDTFIGFLVMALTIIIPGMPNMINFMEMGTDIPKGWTYNPSSWPQRWIMAITGILGWMVSRYLAAYQLGFISHAWDPFFGISSELILNSQMSHSLPISDAGMGSLAYTFEFLMAFMGSPARWRTMPWMVTFFGILVLPLGLVHIFLVISQPVVVGQWCAFCLLAAAIMLPMLPLEVDEVIAMGQFMRRKVKAGESFWKVFWKGGGEEDEKTPHKEAPDIFNFSDRPSSIVKSSFWGMNFPLTLILSMISGIAVTFLADGAHVWELTGLLTITFSVLAMGEPLRILRYLNLALAVVLVIFDHTILAIVLSAIIFLTSLPKGKIENHFGKWDKLIR